MRFVLLLALSLFFAAPALAAPPVYDFDKEHMRIMFRIDHAGFSEMIGEFKDYEGEFTFDKNIPEVSSVLVTINTKSVQTSSTKLDEHLQSKDFFNCEAFPEMTFRSATIKVTGENTGTLEGDLTLLGVTKPVVLDVTFNKEGDMMGAHKVGFALKTTLKRSDFGMKAYLPTIGDDVTIEIQAEGVKRDPTPGVKEKK